MKKLFLAILTSCLFGCQSNPQASPVPDQIRQEIRAANSGMEQALQAGDLLGVAAFYLDDSVLLSPSGTTVSGREAIDSYWARFTRATAWELQILELEGNAELVSQRGRSLLTFREDDGTTRIGDVQFVLIWRRQEDGSWKIAVDAYWPTENSET